MYVTPEIMFLRFQYLNSTLQYFFGMSYMNVITVLIFYIYVTKLKLSRCRTLGGFPVPNM